MYIQVMVTAGARREMISKKDETKYDIFVREPAERNMANKRIVAIFRKLFPAAKTLRIISGHRSPKKVISID